MSKYSLFNDKTTADSDATNYEKLLAGTTTVSSLGYSFSSDKRNSPYKPSSGYKYVLNKSIIWAPWVGSILSLPINFARLSSIPQIPCSSASKNEMRISFASFKRSKICLPFLLTVYGTVSLEEYTCFSGSHISSLQN